jgi:hypothetical protein
MTTYFYNHPRTFIASVWSMMLIAIAVLTLLTSCSVHKTVQRSKTSTDSTSISSQQETNVSTHDSSITKEGNETWERETVVEYVPDTNVGNMATIRPTRTSLSFNSPEIRGIRNESRVSKITIREKGTLQTKQTGTYSNKDSLASEKSNRTSVAKETEDVNKKVEREAPGYMWIVYTLVGLAVLAGAVGLVRKFVA